MTLNTIARAILDAHNENGGSTFTIDGTNCAGQDAYAVAIWKPRELVIDNDGTLTLEDIKWFIQRNFGELSSFITRAVGTWYDRDSGKTYVDIVVVEPNRQIAELLGRHHQQKAIYHLKTGEVINL